MKIVLLTILFVMFLTNSSFSNKLDSGLIAYFPFNGNTNDQSGNGNHGTNFGATLTSDRFGRTNKAYSFNSNYIEVPNSASLQSPINFFSLCFWTNISQWTSGAAGFIGKSGTSATGQYGSVASSTPNVQLDLGGQNFVFSKTIARNVWNFICFTWDGQKIRLYINGNASDSVSYSGTILPDNFPLTIGKHSAITTTYLRGKLDDIRIYDRALTKAEVALLNIESILNLTVLPEGFYNTSSLQLRMKDTVNVYLREALSPFQIKDSSEAVIDSVTFQGNYSVFVPNGDYYLAVRHRNSIETWSRLTLAVTGDVLDYDFSSSGSQAFGYNLKLKGSKYCIYSGDENQDGNVDLSDISDTFNNANDFISGYVKTDLSGDRFVDVEDVLIAYNNSKDFVNVLTPANGVPSCNLSFPRTFSWSGFTWYVVSSNETTCNPGHNYFSSSTNNVYVDGAGELHLKITKSNGKYYCAELFTSQTVGYGNYIFNLASRVDNIDENAVLGLFTWNDENCETNANSELDIEFTRWGDATNPDFIEYSVQPTNGGQEHERDSSWPMILSGNNSIHFLSWTPTLVSFSSYQGNTNPPPPANLISSWSFNSSNPPKSKEECISNPIVIPNPESSTTLNLNLWLNRGNFPSNDQEVEVIIHSITYTPTFRP